jgi:hypothetical protein
VCLATVDDVNACYAEGYKTKTHIGGKGLGCLHEGVNNGE